MDNINVQTKKLLALRDEGADTLTLLKAAQKLLQLKQESKSGAGDTDESSVKKLTTRLDNLEKKMGSEESRIGSLENAVGVTPPASMCFLLSILSRTFCSRSNLPFSQNLQHLQRKTQHLRRRLQNSRKVRRTHPQSRAKKTKSSQHLPVQSWTASLVK
jgi:hypothetical protein